MANSTVVLELPDCNICQVLGYAPVRKAKYDMRSRDGRWCYACTSHYREYRMHRELGTGKGQKLEVK